MTALFRSVGARTGRRIPRLALRPGVADLEAARLQARAEILRAGRVGLARRIDRGEADEIAGESDEVVALGLDAREEGPMHRPAHRSTRPPSASRRARPTKQTPAMPRAEERRVGNESVSTCRSRGSQQN